MMVGGVKSLIVGALAAALINAGSVMAEETTMESGFKPAVALETPAKLELAAAGDDLIKANLAAEIVIFDIFNMYCPKCQKKAPKTEAFHQLLKKRQLTGRILLLGIATQNTNYEAAVFMRKFKLTFTVYSDRNSAYYELLDSKKWPWFVVMKRREDGLYQVVYRGRALDGAPEAFLDKVLEVCE